MSRLGGFDRRRVGRFQTTITASAGPTVSRRGPLRRRSWLGHWTPDATDDTRAVVTSRVERDSPAYRLHDDGEDRLTAEFDRLVPSQTQPVGGRPLDRWNRPSGYRTVWHCRANTSASHAPVAFESSRRVVHDDRRLGVRPSVRQVPCSHCQLCVRSRSIPDRYLQKSLNR